MYYHAEIKLASPLAIRRSVMGHIFNDKKGRFSDETFVTTSTVLGTTSIEKDHYFTTRNTTYKILD